MVETYLDEFNEYMREFGSRTFLVAGRIFDLAPDNWERLAALWYQKNGLLELSNDRYIGKHPKEDRDIVRYHSVDDIVLNPPTELAGIGRHIFDGWQGEKARIIKRRSEDPVVILPPPPNPPMPKPIELPPKQEEPKKPRPEWRVRLGVYLVLATPIVAGVSLLLPPPWNILGKVILEIVKVINGG